MNRPKSHRDPSVAEPRWAHGHTAGWREVIALVDELRRLAGDEVCLRGYGDDDEGAACARVYAVGLRRRLGGDYLVRTHEGRVYARARLAGEPVFLPGRGLQLDPTRWCTMAQAEAILGCNNRWLRERWINRGAIATYRVNGRVYLDVAQVHAANRNRTPVPGGALAARARDRNRTRPGATPLAEGEVFA